MAIVQKEVKTVVNIDWAALAQGVEALVMDKLKTDLEHWAGAEHLGMRQMFVQDCADGLAVCETMIDKRAWHAVESKLWDMDTAARDYVYDFIAEVGGADFFDLVR